ncbi:tripartite tricarboxylate transporter TctB family protein [Paenarthrobacter sp. TA1.8]|uniref:tripartite tricarboxylate transporter TctB family protein n=1 Tax=Paenarthrobacter sp. TA1.8 TaxID=3400219 RepID=UPI003B42C68D
MNKKPFNEGNTVPDNEQRIEDVERKQHGFLSKHIVTLSIIAAAAAILAISLSYRVGDPTAPGPGFWPAIIASVVIVLCIVLLFTPHLDSDSNQPLTMSQWRLLALAILPLLLFVPLLLVAGTPIAAALLAFYSLKVLHGCSTKYSLLWAVILTAAVYVIFIVGLGISLPAGLIFGGSL